MPLRGLVPLKGTLTKFGAKPGSSEPQREVSDVAVVNAHGT